jgi:nitroreductase
MTSIKELLLQNRSYRRFAQEPILSQDDLVDLVESVRLSPSARNDQPLRFILVESPKACDTLFPFTAWAGYLRDWSGPDESERPTSYIIILVDTTISKKYEVDVGIAAQSILLTAAEKGFGGCMLGAIKRDKIRDAFDIDPVYDIPLVIALGKPAETVITEDIKNNDTHYYRDKDDIHHVPKRTLDELILENY